MEWDAEVGTTAISSPYQAQMVLRGVTLQSWANHRTFWAQKKFDIFYLFFLCKHMNCICREETFILSEKKSLVCSINVFASLLWCTKAHNNNLSHFYSFVFYIISSCNFNDTRQSICAIISANQNEKGIVIISDWLFCLQPHCWSL